MRPFTLLFKHKIWRGLRINVCGRLIGLVSVPLHVLWMSKDWNPELYQWRSLLSAIMAMNACLCGQDFAKFLPHLQSLHTASLFVWQNGNPQKLIMYFPVHILTPTPRLGIRKLVHWEGENIASYSRVGSWGIFRWPDSGNSIRDLELV